MCNRYTNNCTFLIPQYKLIEDLVSIQESGAIVEHEVKG